LLCYSSMTGPTPLEDRRIRYMGFGIGGIRQLSPLASAIPLVGDYPGTNVALDTNPKVTQLERPVRVSVSDYLFELPVPVLTSSTFYSATYTASLGLNDLTYGSYLSIPVSELGLFLSGSDVEIGTNQPMGYDICEMVTKTQLTTLDVNWAVRF